MLSIKIKLEEGAKMPVKGTEHAACYDVYAYEIKYREDSKVEVSLGFSTEIPKGWKAILVPRSNLSKYYWEMNHSFGVIDSDYRDVWEAVFTPIVKQDVSLITAVTGTLDQMVSVKHHYSTTAFPYKTGERVAQFYLERVNNIHFIQTNTLETSERAGGFGSTGLK